MFGLNVKTQDTTKDVAQAEERARFRNFFHAAAGIRKTAAQSVEKADGPSQPGGPVHTHRGAFYRRALRFAADKEGATIGPRFSMIGESGEAHEFGGSYKGAIYPERPTMGLALEENLDRFADSWSGSIGD